MTGRKTLWKWIRRPFFAFLLAAIGLLTLHSAGAEGTEKREGFVSGIDEGFFCWCYATDSLPEGVEAREYATPLFLYEATDSTRLEEREPKYTIRTVSGTEALRDAVKIRNTAEGLELYVDNEVIRTPGESVCRITLEGGQLRAERECRLLVLPWEGSEAAALRHPAEMTLEKGETVDEAELLERVLENRIFRVSAAIQVREASRGFVRLEERAELGLKPGKDIPEDAVTIGSRPSGGGALRTWKINEYGDYPCEASFAFANIQMDIPVVLHVPSYRIAGPAMIRAGESGTYRVEDAEAGAKRTFTWAMAGKGARVDAETGTVTVDASCEPSVFTLRAIPSTGEAEATFQFTASDGILEDYRTMEYTSRTGFSFQVITDEEKGFVWGKTEAGIGAQRVDPETFETLYEEFSIHGLADFKENPEDARAFYDRYDFREGESILAQEDISIDGHPARIVLRVSLEGGMVTYIGSLYYARNNTVLKVRLLSIPAQGSGKEPPRMTASDLKLIAAGITYDESAVPLKQSDGLFLIACQEGQSEIIAGKSLNFGTWFNKAEIRGDERLSAVSWRVTEGDAGPAPEGVSITSKGQLTTKKKISRVLNLKVIAESALFHTRAEYAVTVIPIVSRLAAEPSAVTLYRAEDSSAEVRVSMVPSTIPPIGLSWSVAPAGIAEVTPEDDGRAVIRAIAAGRATVTVRELGGKNATIRVRVVEPVEDLRLSVRGTPRPGGRVRLVAEPIPAGAAVKDVTWALDAADSVAAVSRSGNVTISPSAPSGTEITATCTAIGAPEPVVRSITFTVK